MTRAVDPNHAGRFPLQDDRHPPDAPLSPYRTGGVLAVGVALVLVALADLIPMLPREVPLAIGGTLFVVAVTMFLRDRLARRARATAFDLLNGYIERDATPGFITDEDGRIRGRNEAAASRFAETDGTLANALRSLFANPRAVFYRLQCRADLDGSAREDVVTQRGQVRIVVHQVRGHGYVWRVEDLPERAVGGRSAESLPVPLVTVGRSGAVLFMNEAARELVGERVKSIERLFVSPPVQSGAVNTLQTVKGPVDAAVVEQSGSAGRREFYLLPLTEIGGRSAFSALEALPVRLIELDGTGRILGANKLAKDLLSVELRTETTLQQVMEGLGRPISDWLRAVLEGRSHQTSEFLRVRRQDREVFVQVALSVVAEQGEKRLIAVLNDATELKTLEAQFVQSQKMQAIGQLAGGVAHDFNNLLTAISGHCDLLLLRHDPGDQDYGDLVQINQNANRAAALVRQLLAFSRKQTLGPEVIDLRDTLSDLTHLLNRLVGEKVTLTLSHDPVLKPIRADKRQLEQVMMNLVVNARDAMPEGGEIRIDTEVAVLAQPLQRDRATVPAGEYVTVKVTDEGVGIARDKLAKVFEPFFTTKRTGEGTGLGLSTVYGIIKQTGGFIFVDSVVDRGTSFTLYFPVSETRSEEALPTAEAIRAPAPLHGEGVVLLVEDEAPVRAFASRALRLRGYTVLEAESAEEALSMLDDPDLSVDVFVTDVVMPGLDGPSWVREARKVRPDVRVVFVSGYAEGAFGNAEPPVPNSVFLPKPFSLSQLTDTVHQQLH